MEPYTKYSVCLPTLTGRTVLAKGMSIDNALLFVKALMNEFYDMPTLSYEITREWEERTESNDE